MSGGEMKNVLTLDVSKFESALDRATGNLKNFDKSFKSATQVAQEFEKNVLNLGGDIGSVADKFKLLEQTVGNLVGKLSSSSASIDNVTKSIKSQAEAVVTLKNGAKAYDDQLIKNINTVKLTVSALDAFKPSLQRATKGFDELTKAQSKNAESAKKNIADTLSSQIEADIKAEESSRRSNLLIVEQKRKLAQDLQKIEAQIRNESLSHKVAADNYQNRFGAPGQYKNKIAAELTEADRLDANANVIRGQIAAIDELIAKHGALAQASEKQIALLHIEAADAKKAEEARREELSAALIAEKSKVEAKKLADKERIESERQVEKAAKDAARAQIVVAREIESERKAAARRTAQYEQEQARQIAQMWKGIGQLWAASKIEAGFGKGIDLASQQQQVEMRLKLLNLPTDEMEEFKSKAFDITREEKYISTIDAVQSRLDALSAIGHNDTKIIDSTINKALQNAQVMMSAGYEHGNRSDLIKNLYGFAEARQVMNDPNKVVESFDIARRIGVASAGKVNIADLETVARNIGDLRQSMSSEGWLSLATLMEQYKVAGSQGHGGAGAGVSSVGTMLKMMALYASGKPVTNEAAKQLLGADVMNDVFADGTAEQFQGARKNNEAFQKSIKTAGFKGVSDMMNNPVAFFSGLREQIIAYTKDKKNSGRFYSEGADVNSDEAEAAALKQFFAKMGMSNKTVDGMLTMMNKGFIERSTHVLETAKGSANLDDSLKNMKDTWTNSVSEMEAGAKSLAASFEPILKPLSAIPRYLGDILTSASEFVRNNPITANIALATTAVVGLNLAFKGLTSTFGIVGNLSTVLRTLVEGTQGASTAASTAGNAWYGFGKQAEAARASNLSHAMQMERTAEKARVLANESVRAAQAYVASKSGVERLTAAQQVLIPAQQSAAKASIEHAAAVVGVNNAAKAATIAQKAMTVASRGLAVALNMVGGIPGLIAIALIAGISAWDRWGAAAETAASKASKATEDVLDKLHQLEDEKSFGAGDLGKYRKNLEELDKKLSLQAQSGTDLTAKTEKLSDGTMVTLREKRDMTQRLVDKLEKREMREAAPASTSHPAIKDTSDLFAKQTRQFENAFQTSFADMVGKINVAKLKIDTTLSGNSSYDEQAKAEFSSKWLQGDFDDGKDPSKRKFLKKGVSYNKDRGFTEDDIDWNAKDSKTGVTVQQWLERASALKKAEDQQKSLNFAVQRAQATDVEAARAMDRLVDGHLKDTDAMKALNKEFARQDGRTKGATGDEDYKKVKRVAIGNQAIADYGNAGADIVQKNKELQAQLLGTERDRLVASVNATYDAEVEKYKTIQKNLDKTIADFEAAEDKKNQTYLNAIEAKKIADANYTKYLELQEMTRQRALMSPMEKMLEDWRDGYKQLQDMGTSWANSLSDTLANALQTGKLDLGKFLAGVASDASRSAIRQGIGGIVGMLMPDATKKNETTPGLSSNSEFMGPAAPGMAAVGMFDKVGESLKSFWNKITGSTEAVGESTIKTVLDTGATVSKTTAEGTATGSLVTLTAAATAAANALTALAGSGGGSGGGESGAAGLGGLAGLFGNSGGGADAGEFADGPIITPLAEANGDIFTKMGPEFFANGAAFTNGIYSSPTLFKFANGGKFGVMGEAGPEAVMPLSRDANGRLGVTVSGDGGAGSNSGAPVVNIAISVNKDGSSDTKASGDESGIWKKMADRVKGVVQQELVVQQRPGGLLYK